MTSDTTAHGVRGARSSNWGRWGADDERGALNLIDAEAVLAALGACRTGVVYPLGLPIQLHGSGPVFDYRGTPQRLTLMNHGDPGSFVEFGAAPDVGTNEDVLVLASHTLTHMDALSHVFAEGTLYNGFPMETVRTHTGAARCGIDKVGAVVGRAVHLDLPGQREVPWLEPGYVITADDLRSCARHQGVEIGPGDVLLVRTGFLDYWRSLADPAEAVAQPGIGLGAVELIAERDVAVVGSDNSAVEPVPFDQNIFLGVHMELLINLGVHMFEHLNLGELAAAGVHECLFVAAPLNVPGASGSPVNPLAIA
jgi:kynurenine formamidase